MTRNRWHLAALAAILAGGGCAAATTGNVTPPAGGATAARPDPTPPSRKAEPNVVELPPSETSPAPPASRATAARVATPTTVTPADSDVFATIPPPTERPATERPAAVSPAANPAGRANPPNATPAVAAPSGSSLEARALLAEFQQLLGELETSGAIDAAKRDEMLANLRNTDPSLHPQLLEVYRGMAKRQQAERPPAAPRSAPAAPAADDEGWALPAAGAAQRTNTAPPSARAPSAPSPSAARVSRNEPTTGFVEPNLTAEKPSATAERAAEAPVPAPAPQPTLLPSASPPVNRVAYAAPAETEAESTDLAARMQRLPGVAEDRPTAPAPAPRRPVPTPPPAPVARNAHEQLTDAIGALEKAPAASDPEAELDQQIRLRMLYLAAGRKDDALRPLSGAAPEAQRFWSEQLFALATWLDREELPDVESRATAALAHYQEALAQLRGQAGLVVKNLAFCTEVLSFGKHTRFESYEFQPGDEVLLYTEVENFQSRAGGEGFYTELKSSYTIVDEAGKSVAEKDFRTTEETCQNRRRDYFIGYRFHIPENLPPGRYTLKLAVEDRIGRKSGEGSLDFTIRKR